MSEISRALGQEGSFVWEGKTYRLSPMTYECMALWEDYLTGRAWKELERARRHLSPEMYERQERGYRTDIAAGVYSFMSLASVQAQLSWEGMIELAAVRVIVAHPELDPQDVRKMVRKIQEDDVSKWAELKRKLREDDDPNPPAPEASPGPTSPTPAATTSTQSAPGS